MVLEASITADTSRGIDVEGSKQPEVAVSSDSAAKLRAGLAATEVHAEGLHQKWEEKSSKAKKVYMCKGCGKKCKTLAGIKGHWRAKKKECTKDSGYEEVPDVEITMEDRMTPEEIKAAELRKKGMEAAKKVAKEMNATKQVKESKSKADELYKTHVSKLPDLLKTAEEGEIMKFLTMRFDVNNATKQHLAMKELAIRKQKKR